MLQMANHVAIGCLKRRRQSVVMQSTLQRQYIWHEEPGRKAYLDDMCNFVCALHISESVLRHCAGVADGLAAVDKRP